MVTETTPKAPLRQRVLHEFKELVLISLYLYISLGAVILLKAAVLHTEGIEFTPWGIAIIKALVLAKFILLGEDMKVGGRDTSGPLIWPTLRKVFGLLVLLIVMTTIEEAVVGLIHSRSVATSLRELFGSRLQETLAEFLIMLVVLSPYCAFRVLDQALGEGSLARMFFAGQEPRSNLPIDGRGRQLRA